MADYEAGKNIRIEFSGVDLATLSPATRQAITGVVTKIALDMQAEAQKAAPVDTGNLKNSIFTQVGRGPVSLRKSNAAQYGKGKVRPGKTTLATAADDIPADDLPDVADRSQPVTAEVGTGVEYAEYVEFGTVKAAAQPFFFPAAEKVRTPFAQALAVVLARGVTETGGTP